MIDYQAELEKMVCPKNLMNSYKLYLLKSIILNVTKEKKEFDFYQLACFMCAYSFEDVCLIKRRIRHLDKLYDIAVELIEKENLYQSARVEEVFDSAYNTENKGLRKKIGALCNYVPYRLLAYNWPAELKGKNDAQRNRIIEELSRSEKRNIYAIFTIMTKNKRIEVREEWAKYIYENRSFLARWINEKIQKFIER